MKFNKLLHPEIVLDKRGNSKARTLYREILNDIEYHNDNGFKACDKAHQLYMIDPQMVTHLCICKKFKIETPKIYHIPKDFLSALSTIDRKIPVDKLPERFFGYISFSDETLKDESGYIQGAYVFIGNSNETSLGNKMPNQRCIWSTYVDYTEPMSVATNLCAPLKENATMKDIMYSVAQEDSKALLRNKPSDDDILKREVIYRTLINTILYINSSDNELEFTQPFKKNKGFSKNKLKSLKKVINESTVPVTLVNRHYHGMVYDVDNTLVRGHLRWQRCGVNNSGHKLIWVREHVRTYKKEIKDDK